MAQPLTVPPGTSVRLADFEPREGGTVDREAAERETVQNSEAIDDLSFRLYAENRRALLLVLQGMDGAGKDGTIRRVFDGIDPQSCRVTAFKQPTEEELAHDFLWRVHQAAPRRGEVGIFNRSHYEDVIVVRIRNLVPKDVWEERYELINDFERLLHAGGTRIVKVYLHISRQEQRKRLQARFNDPRKRWKFNPGDLAERLRWDDYIAAYDDALTRCNTGHAPWHIVPADRKWYRNLIVSRILGRTLEEMDPQFPPAAEGLEGTVMNEGEAARACR